MRRCALARIEDKRSSTRWTSRVIAIKLVELVIPQPFVAGSFSADRFIVFFRPMPLRASRFFNSIIYRIDKSRSCFSASGAVHPLRAWRHGHGLSELDLARALETALISLDVASQWQGEQPC
jgi:hypothetical protein